MGAGCFVLLIGFDHGTIVQNVEILKWRNSHPIRFSIFLFYSNDERAGNWRFSGIVAKRPPVSNVDNLTDRVFRKILYSNFFCSFQTNHFSSS